MNERIRIMIDSRELEEAPAPDREVTARWRKAAQTFADSQKDLAPESAVTLAYQAGLQAVFALVRAAGYRIRANVTGHHHVTFEALWALDLGELARLARRMDGLRRKRHDAVYEWSDEDDPASAIGHDPQALTEVVGQILVHGREWLSQQRPALSAELPPPPVLGG